MIWEFGCIGVLGSELKYYNTCNSFFTSKYFLSVFARECRLKAEPYNLWCPCVILYLIISQFHFSCVSASPNQFSNSGIRAIGCIFGVGILFTCTTLFAYTHCSHIRYYSRIRHYSCIRYCSYIWYCSRETVRAIQEFCSAKKGIVVWVE